MHAFSNVLAPNRVGSLTDRMPIKLKKTVCQSRPSCEPFVCLIFFPHWEAQEFPPEPIGLIAMVVAVGCQTRRQLLIYSYYSSIVYKIPANLSVFILAWVVLDNIILFNCI